MTNTLLEIYESFSNGQKKQFVEQVQNYGKIEFVTGLTHAIECDIVSAVTAFDMLKTIIVLTA